MDHLDADQAAASSPEQLASLREGDGTLLDKTVLLYGSTMGDSNLHNHTRVPFSVTAAPAERSRVDWASI